MPREAYLDNPSAALPHAVELVKSTEVPAAYFSMEAELLQVQLDAQSGTVDQCAEMLGSMREEFGIEPDRTTSSTNGKDFCMMGHIDQAVAVMESARRTGFAADVIIYNTILDGCSTRDNFEMCDRLYRQMIEDGVKPTNFTLTVMIKE